MHSRARTEKYREAVRKVRRAATAQPSRVARQGAARNGAVAQGAQRMGLGGK